MKTTGNRRLLVAALAIAVAALTFGSVQSTGALLRDQETVQGSGTLATGKLVLTAGAGGATQSTEFQFTNLKSDGRIAQGGFAQQPLVISDDGTIPLKFRLGSVAVPSVSSAVATVHVDVRQVADTAACPTTGALPAGTSTLLNADVNTKGTVQGSAAWIQLARQTIAVLCVRSTLVVDSATEVTYQHLFTFQAQQSKNNP